MTNPKMSRNDFVTLALALLPFMDRKHGLLTGRKPKPKPLAVKPP